MINLKTYKEIDLMRKSSSLVSLTHSEIAKFIKPGVNSLYLDKIAEEFIRDHGGEPGFKGYNGFPNTLCVSKDHEVVHGIPNDQEIDEGVILSIDCGVYMNGFYGDSAYSYPVGNISKDKQKLLDVTKEALQRGVLVANCGNTIGDIGYTIQKYAESNGFSVVKELVGHGIGRNLHESPEVPNYGIKGSGSLLEEGMVIAIEPMINLGSSEVIQKNDGWTIVTKDGLPSAHFEYTVAINKTGPEILSPFNLIEEALN
ncbi:MAG: type I methionyl aminopeptidase [Flavobacteriales bacterium]|nr:type I methionyl aminopeptidase [Flavobacteriales bacterium]|tara:strand:+ start:25058 stop:25828 length:771 start_codon:yes stop_codon:yes gene_type:complete